MTKEEIAGQESVKKKSPFKRFQNFTVLSIFIAFVVIIVALQLITTGASQFPTFISPVNLLNIMQQIGVSGIIAVGMTMVMISGGIDLSVGMLASLVSIISISAIHSICYHNNLRSESVHLLEKFFYIIFFCY